MIPEDSPVPSLPTSLQASPVSVQSSPKLTRITPLRRKLEKVLSIEIDANVAVALSNLSTFYDSNTPAKRHTLRDDIETRCVGAHWELIEKYGEIQKSLEAIEGDIRRVQSHCEVMEGRLHQSLQDSGALVKRAESLNQAKKSNESQQQVLTEFMKHFQLTDEEVKLLSVKTIDNIAFFEVLKKVRTIQQNCKLLLESQNQNAGLEIMEKMSEYLESANKLIYWWVKNECRTLDSDEPEVSNLLVEAFSALSERPVLLSYCLQEIGDTRNKAIKLSFMIALTKGGDGTRPIEIHTHDPYRYVSDMAAWIHQSLASESELIFSLLRKTQSSPYQQDDVSGTSSLDSSAHEASRPDSLSSSAATPRSELTASNNNELASRPISGKKKYTEQVSQILNKCLTDVAAPFKARFLQTLSLKPKMILVVKLAYLVDFYRRNFLQLLGPMAVLTRVFGECKADAMKVFFALAKKKNESTLASPPIPSNDTISIPHDINEMLSRTREVLVVFSSSLCSLEEKIDEAQSVLELFVPAIVKICDVSSLALSPLEKLVYTLNILLTLKELLLKFDFVPNVFVPQREIDGALNELKKSVAKYKETRVDERSKNVIPRNSVERMAEKKLMKIAKTLITRAEGPALNGSSGGSSSSPSSISTSASESTATPTKNRVY